MCGTANPRVPPMQTSTIILCHSRNVQVFRERYNFCSLRDFSAIENYWRFAITPNAALEINSR
jgi:hypothetical protein